jgi:hypothetical protein
MTKSGFAAALLAALFLLQLTPARAQSVTLLSEARGVSISGVAGNNTGQSYNQSMTSPGLFAPFMAAVGGTANWTDPSPPYSTPPAANYQAKSTASQTSSIAINEFVASGALYGEGYIPSQGSAPGAGADATTASMFEISFSLSDYKLYSLSFLSSYFHADGSEDPGDQIGELPGLYSGQTDVLGGASLGPSGKTYTGTLAPGNYTLVYDPNSNTVTDPLGDSLQLSYNLDFKIAPVPEPSSYLALGLLVVVCVVPAVRRRSEF